MSAAAADEIILGDIAHLRPWILTRLHYNSITFFLIKMGKVTHERLSPALWPLAVDTVLYCTWDSDTDVGTRSQRVKHFSLIREIK